jgi:hypothetical protein
MNKPVYALSIKQPWAWLICKGFKDIENRDWTIGRNPNYGQYKNQKANFKLEIPQRIYVHASKIPDKEVLSQYGWIDIKSKLTDEQYREMYGHTWKDFLSFGAIIGEVTIEQCVDDSSSPWFVGRYGFVLTDAVIYEKPIPCRGQLGFFKPEI